jgi:hypothetical protein
MSKTGLRAGGAGLYVLLTLLTIVVLGIVGVGYVARSVKVATVHRANGDDVSIQTPGGQFRIRAHENLDPAALGVPMYPGAKHTKDGGGATFEWTSSDGKNDKSMAVAGGDYITSDAPDTVRAWYHDHLPNWVVVTDRHDKNARFELNDGGYKRIIAIREKSDGTHIGVATVGEPASN